MDIIFPGFPSDFPGAPLPDLSVIKTDKEMASHEVTTNCHYCTWLSSQ